MIWVLDKYIRTIRQIPIAEGVFAGKVMGADVRECGPRAAGRSSFAGLTALGNAAIAAADAIIAEASERAARRGDGQRQILCRSRPDRDRRRRPAEAPARRRLLLARRRSPDVDERKRRWPINGEPGPDTPIPTSMRRPSRRRSAPARRGLPAHACMGLNACRGSDRYGLAGRRVSGPMPAPARAIARPPPIIPATSRTTAGTRAAAAYTAPPRSSTSRP